MQEKMIEVDGKTIKESEMPKDCFLIQGKWYTEKGLPKELAAYKRLWADVKATKQLGKTDDEEKKPHEKKSTTPTPATPPEPTNTAQRAADAAPENNADT